MPRPQERPWMALYPESVRALQSVPDMTLGDMLTESRRRFGSRTALTFEDQTWSYDDVYAQSHAFARLLRKEGLASGDRLAVILPNRPEYIFAIFGTVLAGGIVVQVNVRYPAEEMRRILDDAGAEFVVTTDEAVMRCSPGETSFLGRKLFRVDLTEVPGTQAGTPLSILSEHLDGAPVMCDRKATDVAVLQYTGGTTGAAKGVMLTHRNLIANIEQRYAMTYGLLETPPGAKTINVLPTCHVYGLTAVTLLAVRSGMNQILVSDFKAAEMLRIIKREQPYVFSGVPTMYAALNREPAVAESGLGKVTIYNSAGAGFPQEHLELFERKSGGKIIEGFGISEASPSTHLNPVLFADRRVGSIGIPVPLTDVRIVDKDGAGIQELPVGEVGEMIVKGPQIMKGYWNRPDLTKETLRDGWLLTGDLATMDEQGYFYIVGRKKEMIVTSGFNVYPAEVEQVLTRFPGILEAAVVGTPDEYRGESVEAFITLEPGAVISDEELDAHCRKHLAAYKVPRKYSRLDSLPKTPVGKIAKKQLPTGVGTTADRK
ncbi:long-chain-fatty-acid--CoA ligase [Pseudarthrobacter psychrotolerans]|uniref:AMP-binding protein n=1 Tax=Pseudarthrobacter psychrotolerans TaxID=2697569 RepID=A0A6P1NY93_9MICC|nr:long-chain fatty acid--CoA ligase [Pseudarthrobacter psychrotolerans]QHK22602.1 AMP-binding protein [Pseudarthrobacter psychrotolerans]